MTARHIYVDETKQRHYLLVASVHISTDLTDLRGVVRSLLLPGQRYLHMKDEKDGRKRTIAQAFVDAGVQATVYRAGPQHRNERDRRSACLKALVQDHASASTVRLVFDEDETMVSFDNQRMIEYTRAAGCRQTLSYEHKQSHADALLAIPDAIAWCQSGYLAVRPVRDALDRELPVMTLSARAVRGGIDPPAGQAQFRLGELLDRRQGGPVHDQHPALVRTEADARRPRSVHQVGDGFGRQAIATRVVGQRRHRP